MSPYSLLLEPFVTDPAYLRALAGCLALAIGAGPIGVLLTLRRMSLMGDAMSHAILPGVAVAFLVSGLSIPAMAFGGLVAGLIVALLAVAASRLTELKEDTSFAGFYITSLALGVLIVSMRGSNEELVHVLFGDAAAMTTGSLLLVAGAASLTLLILAAILRPLLTECFDPAFLRVVDGRGPIYHGLFLGLVVVNLVAGFQALGSLLSVGFMMLPAAAARLWSRDIRGLFVTAGAIAMGSAYLGLVAAHASGAPPGPSIILTAGIAYIGSIVLGRNGGILARYFPPPHYH